MKLKYFVKLIDRKGQLIDVEAIEWPEPELFNPNGYDSYNDARMAIKKFFPGQKTYNYLRSQLIICPQFVWRNTK